MRATSPTTSSQILHMCIASLLLVMLSTGRFGFFLPGWLCCTPLLVVMRARPLPQALALAFGVLFVARLPAWAGALDGVTGLDVVGAAALAAGAGLVPLVVHRLTHAWLPRVGMFGYPAAVVVVEAVVARSGVPWAHAFSLASSQEGSLGLGAWIPALTTAGVAFGCAWAQAVLAGMGEALIVDDAWSLDERERAVVPGAVACMFVLIALHATSIAGGAAHAPVASTTAAATIAGMCGALAVALVIAAVVVRARHIASASAAATT